MQPPTLTVLLLVDGKPGHYHQSEGVIAAIRRMRLVRSHRLARSSSRCVCPTKAFAPSAEIPESGA